MKLKTIFALCILILTAAIGVMGANPGVIGLPGSTSNTNPPGTLQSPSPTPSTTTPNAILWVSPTGNDSAVGSSNYPLATIHGALTRARGSTNTSISPIIIVRGGEYTNDWADYSGIYGEPRIKAYANERPRVWKGRWVTNPTIVRTNSGSIVYKATPNIDLTNIYAFSYTDAGVGYIYEIGTPEIPAPTNTTWFYESGMQAFLGYTNLLEHYRLKYVPGQLTNTIVAGQWTYTNGDLYFCCSDGGLIGSRSIMYPNTTNEFIRNGHGAVAPKIYGLQVLGGLNGFCMIGFGDGWELRGCSGVANFGNGLNIGSNGQGLMQDCAGLENNEQGGWGGSTRGDLRRTVVTEDHNRYIGNARQGQFYHWNATATIKNSFSGWNHYTGFGAYEGATVFCYNNTTASNQMGFSAFGNTPAGQKTYIELHGCNSISDDTSLGVGSWGGGDVGVYAWADLCSFNGNVRTLNATWARDGYMLLTRCVKRNELPYAANFAGNAGVITVSTNTPIVP